MKEERMLYQIKALEKMILRAIIQEEGCIEENFPYRHHPTPTQMQIMEYILEHREEEIYQKDLEEVLNLRRATVSGVLQTMEKNGLLMRVTDGKDARTKKVILNPKAEELFLRRENRMKELERILVKGMKEEDLIIFSNVLKQMKENIKEEIKKREVATKERLTIKSQ